MKTKTKKKLSANFGPVARDDVYLSPSLIISPETVEWSATSLLGQGGSAFVYKGLLKGTDDVKMAVAVKIYNLGNFNLPDNQILLKKEVNELSALKHENVICCLGLCLEKGAIILELAEKEITLGPEIHHVNSLRQLLDVLKDEFPIDIKYESLYQIARGLSYLHAKNIVHGDMKSANVLIKGSIPEEYCFKLSDLGLSHSEITMTGI